MNEIHRRVLGSVGVMAACAAALLTLPALQAQDPTESIGSSSSVPEIREQTLPRVWVGVSLDYTPLKLFSAKTSTDATTGDVVTSTVANGQVGGALNVNLRLRHNYWLNLGASYYFGGYDTNDLINDAVGTLYVERTRARILDFPVLVRYTGPKFRWSRYAFYEVGGTLRYLASLDVHETAVNDNGYFCCAPTSANRFKRESEGITIGTGLVFKDDFGIKSAPEVRYTRYLNSAIAGPTVGTMRNQLEIALTFGR